MRTRIINIIIALAGILALSAGCQREDFLLPETSPVEDGHIRLQPENDDMDPIIVDDCQIVGKVFGCYRFWR